MILPHFAKEHELMIYFAYMKILIITAHPSSTGHTHTIAQSYKENREKKGDEVEIIDLYKSVQLPFYTFENIRDLRPSTEVLFYQEKITAANELVFIHPMWWTNMPGIMKNWLDHCFASHYAFVYKEGKPVGLLTEKTARVFVTCGGPSWIYTLFCNPLKRIWKTYVLNFCGIELTSFTYIDKMAFNDEARFAQAIEKIKNI